jgi:hypothetical protein
MSSVVTAVVVGAGSIAASQDASRKARHASEDAAEDIQQSSIENVQYLGGQGRKAAKIIGTGAKESYRAYEALPEQLKAIISPVGDLVEGSFDRSALEASQPAFSEKGAMADFVGSSVSDDVMSKFANESPAVMREIKRLSGIEGRKGSVGLDPYKQRFSDIETGLASDISNIEATGGERLAQLLTSAPKAQANAMIGQAGAAIPFIESGQEAAGLASAAGNVSRANRDSQIAQILGQAL